MRTSEKSYYRAFRQQEQTSTEQGNSFRHKKAAAPANRNYDSLESKGDQEVPIKVMALTFDDGPTDTTAKVLDLLKEYGAKATFFNIARNAHNPITARVIAEGHTLGGHTYKHDELTDMSVDEVRRDTLLAETTLRNVTSKRIKYVTNSHHPLRFFINSRTLMGCADPP